MKNQIRFSYCDTNYIVTQNAYGHWLLNGADILSYSQKVRSAAEVAINKSKIVKV